MNKDFFNNRPFYIINSYNLFVVAFLILGILIRLFHYIYNRSLWMDEVYLSSSLIRMDYHELINEKLDYQQKAPLGVLLTVKTLLHIFGNNEMALRLFSLITGILSLFIFIPVSKYFTNKTGVVVGLGIMALSPALVFHSVEIKQYQGEMLATLLVLYCYIKFHNINSYRSAFIWGIIGGVTIWFSYSSIFILLSVAGVQMLSILSSRRFKFLKIQIISPLIWISSFLVNYIMFTHRHAESEWIVYWFHYYRTFMPFPPTSIMDLKWFPQALYYIMDYPLGLIWRFYSSSFPILSNLLKLSAIPPLVLLLFGLFSLKERKRVLALLCFPFILVFFASGLKLYPLTERFWVFLCPIFLILIANGLNWLNTKIKVKYFSSVIIVVLLAGPFLNSLVYVVQPDNFLLHKRSSQREALDYLNKNYQRGDVVYIYWNDLPGFRLYRQINGVRFKAIEGKDYRYISSNYDDYLSKLKIDFKAFEGKKRVWVLYNNYYVTDIGDKIDEPNWYYLEGQHPTTRMIEYFSTLGPHKEVFKSFDVNISLITKENNIE